MDPQLLFPALFAYKQKREEEGRKAKYQNQEDCWQVF